MLPAAPHIFDVEDLKKMTGQLHIFIENAMTRACRRVNRMVRYSLKGC